ncbi:LuxR family transcriptional regulator [uncultured Bradyrhizobium sp.]|jgi:DNA-binding CsgD family transcriptional regulator|uniref:helix-turn-helix transcriptional regulator n=1 Tax=uncultured Bradyrhizobium sp. TaxID=199684 RepID=UPI0026295673|nr:LuxR family transcriptional regulator [uncultured Bradyrhizobium sp.]
MNAMLPVPNLSAEAATFADTLDGLDIGLYLLDADARLMHANAAGQAMLDAREILQETRGQLTARDPLVNQALRYAFSSALDASGVAMPMTGDDGQRYVAHALPLASGARRRAGAAYSAAVALFVRKVALTITPCSGAIGKAFKLTPTELRVLLAIVELGGVPEVAAAFGVANTTIRTHVNRLFEKTGTARQADFVKLVAGFATPLRDIGEVR